MAAEQISLLHSIITPISRLTSDKSAIGSGSTIYLDPTVLRVSSRGGGGVNGGDDSASGIACFAELIAHGIFLEHKIESIAGNVIVFDIDLVQLKMALAATLSSMGSSSEGNSRHSSSAPLHNSNDNADSNNNASSFRYNNSSISSSFTVVMKLAKRSGMPCLCLDASCMSGTLDVHHAVPVRILRAEEWP